MILSENTIIEVHMKPKTIIVTVLAITVLAFVAWFGFGRTPVAGKILLPATITGENGNEVADYTVFLNLTETDAKDLDQYIAEIDRTWHPGNATMLLEMTQVAKFHVSRQKIFELLEKKSGEEYGDKRSKWLQWIWAQEYKPHPQYSQFKHDLYRRPDSRFPEYFAESDNAAVRLDELRWSGFKRDAIPPLKSPKMISASSATYLADTDVVFGVSVDGDHRCYPQRILAWHGMFKDTIADISVCGVY